MLSFAAVFCGKPPDVPNGFIAYSSSVFFEGFVNYTCFEGFELTDSEGVTCRDTGEWSAKPECGGEAGFTEDKVTVQIGTMYINIHLFQMFQFTLL